MTDSNLYQEWKDRSKAKRAHNREQSPILLQREGISFESKNYGGHLIVDGGTRTIDFWPGTGLWIVRGDKSQRRGVAKLIEYVKKTRMRQ